MKFRVTLKDPDAFYESVTEAIKRDLSSFRLDEDEKEALLESRREKTLDSISRFVSYGELVTIEFDTDQGTAIVVNKNS